MTLGVLDSGVACAWLSGAHRSLSRIARLVTACRRGEVRLVLSWVNATEILKVTARGVGQTGADPLAILRGHGVELHSPDESVARRAASLRTSLGDAFAAATALELGARLHTTDAELIRRLEGVGLAVTRY